VLTRFLLFALLVLMLARAFWRLLTGVVEGASGRPPERRGPPAKGVPMVRDPVCGTFVVPSRALTLTDGGQIHHFCSEECRRAFQEQPRGRSAVSR